MYCLPLFTDYMNELGRPVEGVAMKIRDLFREIETSNEPVKTSNDMRYLSLQSYEPGMQYNAHDLEKQKGKLTIVQEEEKIDSSKVKL